MGASGTPKPDPPKRNSSACESTASTTSKSHKKSVPSKRYYDGSEATPLGNGLGLNSQVFDIWVGSEPCRFSVHEHYLARSPKFKSMCTSAKLRSGKSKMANVLTLPKENPVDMAYIFEYLYFDTLDIAHADSLEEAKQLANLFTLGCRFQLDDLVKKVVVKLETSKISSQIPAMQYLTLMEGLYLEENYHDLDIYFSNIASNVIQNLEESDYPEFERMIGEGGPYAIALFKGFRIAFGHKSQKTDESNTLPEIKTDSVDEPKTKKPKLSPPDTSPKPSSFWENLSNEDKTLVRLRAQMDSWGQISDTLEKTTGEPHPVNKLINRYNLIIRESDVPRLLSSKLQVESKFEHHSKWKLIADMMVAKGAKTRYPAAFLRKAFVEAEAHGGGRKEEEGSGGKGGKEEGS